MFKVIVPIDGSDNSVKAVEFLVKKVQMFKEPVEICLVNVQYPIASGNVKHYISHDDIESYYQDQGRAALLKAQQVLDQAGISYKSEIVTGEPAEAITRRAKDLGCQQIVMGSRGLGTVSGMLMGSVATKVIHLSEVPVLLVKG